MNDNSACAKHRRFVAQKTGPTVGDCRADFSSRRVVARFFMEAPGIEPGAREIFEIASACVADKLSFADHTAIEWLAGQP